MGKKLKVPMIPLIAGADTLRKSKSFPNLMTQRVQWVVKMPDGREQPWAETKITLN